MQKTSLTLLFTLVLTSCFASSTRAQSSQDKANRGDPDVKVWVDTQYNFYHCPNTKLYGKTKQGVYMNQKLAQDRGYRPAYGTVCNTPPPPKINSKAKSKTTK